MTINVKFDPILGKLRESDVGLVSAASISIPDPLIVNNLQVASTASINFGNFNKLIASTATIGTAHISHIEWNLTSGATVALEGQMNWDATQQSVVVGLAGGNVDVALGMENVFPRRVRNSTGSTMPKGTAVYINGVSGNTPTVTRAIATSDMTSAYTLGLTSEEILDGATGWVTTFGEITGLDLSSFTAGNTLYLSGATAGAFTNQRAYAPTHYVRLGTVVKATADGALVVNVINGFETDELHDVSITSLASGQILQSGTSSLWYNRSLASAIAENISFLSLGSLAVMNQLSFTSLTNQPSLSSLAFQSTVDYLTQITNTPSLGSLAIMNQLSYTSLLNLPSLGSLAFQNNISLGSLAVMNQLSFTSLTNQPSLSSLAFQSTVDYVTQVTSKPSLGSLAVMNSLSYGSLLSAPSLNGDYLRLDLTNTPLSGATLNFDGVNNKAVIVGRASAASTAGNRLTLQAGGATSGSTNKAGGTLQLSSGIATGSGSSDITFLTATAGTSGTTDRTPNQKMVIAGNGNVGIGVGTPNFKLHVIGTGGFSGDLIANNLSGTNTGDTYDSMFGDGSDGYVPFDGNEYPDFATYNSGTLTYTLTRDIYPSECIIQAGVTVLNAGFRIICAAQFTNIGTVSNNGGNASGTTAGTGGTGGFFKAGGNGTAGLGTGSAGAAGTSMGAQTNVIGGVGGRGAVGRAGVLTQNGGNVTIASAGKPAAAVGSSKIASNIQAYLNAYIPSGTAANIQLQPSIGGMSGAKSATGTTATSGGGGGGGGVVFIASPVLNNYGTISANGGNGGNAAGTGGNFGGGGGGGGGVVALVYQPTKSSVGTVTADGGSGGSSVTGTNGTYPVADADNTATGTTTILITPTVMPSKADYLLLPVIVAHTGNGGVYSVEGYGMLWQQVNYDLYNTIATPLRTFELWKGYYMGTSEKNVLDSPYIKITLYGNVTSARAMVDYIHNTSIVVDNSDPQQGSSVASSDSTTNLTVDLGYTPTTGNMVYTVFARVGGTTPVVGTGNTALNNQNTTPFLYSEVSVNRQTNNHTWTTATAASGISVDIGQPTSAESGAVGWGGKIVEIWA